jgi:hypothetical protein
MLSVKLDRPDRAYAPGETLNARVAWSLDSTPECMDLELGWITEGKGTSDNNVVEEEEWTDLAPEGEKTWSVVVPRGPLSLKGQLIRIQWSVTCTVDGKQEVSIPLTVSATKQPVRLSRIDEADA